MPELTEKAKRKVILLIEDDENIASWMQLKLEDKRITFHWLCNYTDAADFLRENFPDVIILDLKLRDGNGTNILKEIKLSNRGTPVYVFSVNNAMKEACLRMGADGFFDKVSDSSKLMEEVNKLI